MADWLSVLRRSARQRRAWTPPDEETVPFDDPQVLRARLDGALEDARKARDAWESAQAELMNLRAEIARLRTVHVPARPSFTRKPAPVVLPASPCDGKRDTCLRMHETLHAFEDRLAAAEGRPVRGVR